MIYSEHIISVITFNYSFRAMSCIFVVQERNMYSSVPEQFFSAALLHDIHKQLVKELEIEKVVDPELTATIKKILKVN